MIEHGHASHTGLEPTHNEDTYWADTEGGLWLVADGMGGPSRGETASAIAVRTIVAATRAGADLAEAIRRGDTAIREDPGQHGADVPMGSTLAALRICGDRYALAWVGDSRIYLWENGALVRATSPCPTPPSRYPTAAADARAAPPRNRLTQALGITPVSALGADPTTGTCTPGMQFLLCSDGLTDELDDPHLAAIVSRTDLAAQECVDKLVLAALDAGGHDNITAVLVRFR